MKKTVKLLTALATAAALILGAGAFVSCSNGSDDDDTSQIEKPDTGNGEETENGGDTGNGEDPKNPKEKMTLTLAIDNDGEITKGGVEIKVTVENADSEAPGAFSKITVTADNENAVKFYSDDGYSEEITAEGWTEGSPAALPDLSDGEFSIYVKAEEENTEENVTVTVTLYDEGDSELATGTKTFGISED